MHTSLANCAILTKKLTKGSCNISRILPKSSFLTASYAEKKKHHKALQIVSHQVLKLGQPKKIILYTAKKFQCDILHPQQAERLKCSSTVITDYIHEHVCFIVIAQVQKLYNHRSPIMEESASRILSLFSLLGWSGVWGGLRSRTHLISCKEKTWRNTQLGFAQTYLLLATILLDVWTIFFTTWSFGKLIPSTLSFSLMWKPECMDGGCFQKCAAYWFSLKKSFSVLLNFLEYLTNSLFLCSRACGNKYKFMEFFSQLSYLPWIIYFETFFFFS